MIYLKGIYDANSKQMVIEFNNNLIENHFEILKECVEENKSMGSLPSDLEVKKVSDYRCIISFHIDIPDTKDGERIGRLPKNMTEKISSVIEKFREKAIKKEFMTTEFIPLNGYPLEELKKDIKEAIKNKRNFCVIDKYSDYLKFYNGEITKLKQKKLYFLSNEYSDAAIYIYEGNMKKLKEIYKNQLEFVDWG